MVKVIFHAGLPKTGTTSAQALFAQNRAALAAEGFFYPLLIEDRFPGHWELGSFWRRRMAPDFHLAPRLDALGEPAEVAERVRRALVQALRRAKAWETGGQDGIVLLSDEHFGNPDAAMGIKRLAAVIQTQGASLGVLAHLRCDPDLYPSWTQQLLKTYGRRPEATPISHVPLFDRLSAGFGADRVRARVFSPLVLPAGDVVGDLVGWIGREAGRPLPALGPAPRINESMPAPGCALILALNQKAREQDTPAFSQLRSAVMHSVPDLRAPKLALTEAMRARVIANAHAAWNAVLARTEHTPAQQDALRLPAPPPAPPLTAAEIETWIASARDPDYERALRAWIAARPERWVPRLLAYLDGHLQTAP